MAGARTPGPLGVWSTGFDGPPIGPGGGHSIGAWPRPVDAAEAADGALGPAVTPGVIGRTGLAAAGSTPIRDDPSLLGPNDYEPPIPTRTIDFCGHIVQIQWSPKLIAERKLERMEASTQELEMAAQQAAGGQDPKAAAKATSRASRAAMLLRWEQERAESIEEQRAESAAIAAMIQEGWQA
jgi:hypothetical protein